MKTVEKSRDMQWKRKKDMLRDKKLFLFDIDGTLALGNAMLEGAYEFLEHIRKTKGRSIFITNNSTKSRKDYVDKFEKWGVSVSEKDFVTASYATALYLQKNFKDQKIFALGTSSFIEELRSFQLRVTEEYEEGIQAVVVGYDNELTYEKVAIACRLLQEKRLPYFGTNPDLACPVPFGMIPDCGAICQMIKCAIQRDPIYLGKPSGEIVSLCLQEGGFKREQTVVVGDRLYTDIACGIQGNVETVLVLTGEAKREDLKDTPYQPTYTFETIGELYKEINVQSEQ